jgi:hypothetical protein
VKAEAALARTTAARWRDLLTTTSVSRQEVDEKNAAAETQAAAVNEAKANLGRLLAFKAYAVVRAPFAGVVPCAMPISAIWWGRARHANPMFAMADDRRCASMSACRSNMPRHPPRPAAHLSVPAWPGRDFEAHVVDQSGAVNSQNGSVQVQLMTANPGGALKPGGFAQVRFDLPVPAGRLTVPASALILRGGGTRGHRGCGRPCASPQGGNRPRSGQHGGNLRRAEAGHAHHRQPARFAGRRRQGAGGHHRGATPSPRVRVRIKPGALALLALLPGLLAGCSQAPAYRPPALPLPDHFSEGGQEWVSASPAAPRVGSLWWRQLGDPSWMRWSSACWPTTPIWPPPMPATPSRRPPCAKRAPRACPAWT